ncbi:MAG TPA: AmpG family muropeptide MFS transporter [Gammaproteobacteria bacterium]|jgi:PAT family beta-lactamase induction signal transducer AmpG|nr:AmpG family muropeptide MFS transporter [Gammaproteobacteria bacterium]
MAPPEAARPQPPWYAFLLSRRLFLCVLQGFSSGLPLYVLIQLVPGWLRSEGVDLSTIGLLSLATLPYTWKFLWSPLIDRFRLPFLGRRRGWAVLSQLALLATIAAFGAIDPMSGPAVVTLMFATALAGATQDIVLDAYRRELLADNELGAGNSFFVQAYRLSSLVPGSLAFILSDHMPWAAVYWVVAAFMVVGILTMLAAPETSDDRNAPRSLRAAVVDPFREFFLRNGVKSALATIAFLFLYKLGDSMAVALQTPFFLDVGFSRTQIGTIAKFSILGATVVSSLIGGLIMLKLPINRALWVFGGVQLTTSLGFAALAAVGPNPYMLGAAAAWEYFGVGLGTVALLAFIAQQTDKRFTATQLALLTSLMVVPRTFAGSITGYIIEAVGYFNFFLICTAVGVPGLLMLVKVAPWSGRSGADAEPVPRTVPVQSSQS